MSAQPTDPQSEAESSLGRQARRNFVVLNVLGGALVLASYIWGVLATTSLTGSLWGGVPKAIQPIYTINMFLAAAGYFAFAPYIGFRLDPHRCDIGGRFDYSVFGKLMSLILIPSACWLPLTAAMLSNPSVGLWWLIRADLIFVALGTLGLFIALAMLRPPRPAGRTAALLGLVPFGFQTIILDALVWPEYFRA
jgi:hypothetical protein